jgi:DNA-binding FrmR family transcriptional regulator
MLAGMPGYEMSKEQLLGRLRRVEGQIRGLQQMVESDRYCIDVLTQISAVTKAFQSVAVGLLDDHLRHCVTDAVATGGGEAPLGRQLPQDDPEPRLGRGLQRHGHPPWPPVPWPGPASLCPRRWGPC